MGREANRVAVTISTSRRSKLAQHFHAGSNMRAPQFEIELGLGPESLDDFLRLIPCPCQSHYLLSTTVPAHLVALAVTKKEMREEQPGQEDSIRRG